MDTQRVQVRRRLLDRQAKLDVQKAEHRQDQQRMALELIRLGIITPRMAGNTNILKLR